MFIWFRTNNGSALNRHRD